MSVSNNLYYAVLTMDSYNRSAPDGSGPRALAVPGDTGQPSEVIALGDATLQRTPLPNGYQNVGFFATACDLNGEVVISYRGTDFGAPGANAPKSTFQSQAC
jgi:hypothetical protein